jgi:hypothetical protein
LVYITDANPAVEKLTHTINNSSTKQFLGSIAFTKSNGINYVCFNSVHFFGSKNDPNLNTLFQKDFTKRKVTFLHPESSLDWYKRTSKGDEKGKSLKTMAFMVPVEECDPTLINVIQQKISDICDKTFETLDNCEIHRELTKRFLDSSSTDVKKLEDDVDQKIKNVLLKLSFSQKKKLLENLSALHQD